MLRAARHKAGGSVIKKKPIGGLAFSLLLGRDGGIRTRDPLHPMQVRYQAALRPEAAKYIKLSTTGEVLR